MKEDNLGPGVSLIPFEDIAHCSVRVIFQFATFKWSSYKPQFSTALTMYTDYVQVPTISQKHNIVSSFFFLRKNTLF